MRIFSHITIGSSEIERSIQFYDALLSILGLERHSTDEAFVGYGHPSDTSETGENSLWIVKPLNGERAHGGNGVNVALLAASRQHVDAFHAKALESGATDDGAPGVRADAHDSFYACYIIDRDGNKLIAVCHDPE